MSSREDTAETGRSLAEDLRAGAQCALRGLLAGNEEQMTAAEEALLEAEEPVRAALRQLKSSLAEQETSTGVERAKMIYALVEELEKNGPGAVNANTQSRLRHIAANLQALGPHDD